MAGKSARSSRPGSKEGQPVQQGKAKRHGKSAFSPAQPIKVAKNRKQRDADDFVAEGEKSESGSEIMEKDECVEEEENDSESLDMQREEGDKSDVELANESSNAVDEAADERPADFSMLVGIGETSDGSDEDGPLETLALSRLPGQMLSELRNDEPALEKKLADIAVFAGKGAGKTTGVPFWESLTVTIPLEQKLSDSLAMDDLKRERRFAELATAAAHEGLELLRKQKTKFRRPADYFAQMVKTDAQMGKVKAKILHQKEKIESAEKRRNNREIAKNRKKIRSTQLQKEQEKKRKAKEEIEAFSQLRKQRLKQRANAGTTGEGDDDDAFPIDLLEVEQLDDENTFRPQADIVSGKKKAWSRQTDKLSNGDAGGKRSIRGGKDAAVPRASVGVAKPGRAKGPNGGVRKTKGSKKRLGRSRRKAGPKQK